MPVKDEHKLSIYWILPYLQDDIAGAPLNYYSHLIGHEGENSLLSYLKDQGWALELSAGGDHELWGFSTMEVNIKLTKLGLENYSLVIEATYQYLQKLKEKGPQ